MIAGSSGSTHGDSTLKTPAPNAPMSEGIWGSVMSYTSARQSVNTWGERPTPESRVRMWLTEEQNFMRTARYTKIEYQQGQHKQGDSMELLDVREKIETIDKQILKSIADRTELAGAVLELKKVDGKSITDKGQEQVVLNRAIDYATELNLDIGSIKQIYEILIRMNIERQHELSGEGNLP